MSSFLVLELGLGDDPLANSYASVDEATEYFSQRLYSDEWDTSDDSDKEKALVMATRRIELLILWNGVPRNIVPGGQPLGWPRVPQLVESQWGNPVVNYASFWRNLSWPYTQVPLHVKWATCELALELLKADRTLEDPAKGIKSVGIGQGAVDITFDSADRKTTLTDPIIQMLKPFGSLIGNARSSIPVTR